MSEMPDRVSTWLERITTIKIGIIGTLFSGGLGVLKEIDWLTVVGLVVAVATLAAQVVRMWTDIQRNKREDLAARRKYLLDMSRVPRNRKARHREQG